MAQFTCAGPCAIVANNESTCARKTERLTKDSAAPAGSPPWAAEHGKYPFITESVRTVADALYTRIASGAYGFGKRLPAEREMGTEFGCSRTVIRKALDVLQGSGLISQRQGRSRYVTFRRSDAGAVEQATPIGESRADIAETTSPLELNIVRTIVEPEIVRLAIINMSARDISNLRAIVDKLAAVTTSAADFAALDEQFHLALAEGAHNTLLTAIYRLINDVRRHAHWEATREKTLSPNRIRDYQKLYRSICSAVEARDVESAVEFVKLVMVEVQRDLTPEA